MIVIAADTIIGMVAGDTAEEALNAAIDIVGATQSIEYSSEDGKGDTSLKTKRLSVLIEKRRKEKKNPDKG